MSKKEIGERVRAIREDHNMTLEELGNKVGKSKQWLSELERGNIRLSYGMSILISRVFNNTPDVFLPIKSKKISRNYPLNVRKTANPSY